MQTASMYSKAMPLRRSASASEHCCMNAIQYNKIHGYVYIYTRIMYTDIWHMYAHMSICMHNILVYDGINMVYVCIWTAYIRISPIGDQESCVPAWARTATVIGNPQQSLGETGGTRLKWCEKPTIRTGVKEDKEDGLELDQRGLSLDSTRNRNSFLVVPGEFWSCLETTRSTRNSRISRISKISWAASDQSQVQNRVSLAMACNRLELNWTRAATPTALKPQGHFYSLVFKKSTARQPETLKHCSTNMLYQVDVLNLHIMHSKRR